MNQYRMNTIVDKRNRKLREELLKQRNQNRVLRILLLTSLCIMISVSFVYAFHSNHKEGGKKEVLEFLVQSGDTLWDISLRYKPEGEDTREYIREIMEINNLESSMIEIGQIIYLPK